ncbi:MAG: nitroreductase family protein [Desulfobacterales bacterium]
MLAELIKQNRTCRRFYQNHRITSETLTQLVDLARLSASAANLQPLKFITSCNLEKNAEIFPCLGWAAYLKDWSGPVDGERPAGYIIILGDTTIGRNFDWDLGIAGQSILLGAREKGLAGCMIASLKKKKLQDLLDVDPAMELLLVIALGKPAEEVCIDPVGKDGNIQYWRDQNGVHHVPKRDIEEIIIGRYS